MEPRGAGDRVAGGVDHVAALAVARADPAQIADVVQQGGGGEVQPVARADRLGHDAAAQDRLADIGDEQGVQDVVVDRVGAGDPLQREPGGGADDRRVVGLGLAVDRAVVAPQPVGEGVDHQKERLEHRHIRAGIPAQGCAQATRRSIALGAPLSPCRRGHGPPKIGWRTRAPGSIPSFLAVPAFSSSTACTGCSEGTGVSENGTVSAAI